MVAKWNYCTGLTNVISNVAFVRNSHSSAPH